MRRNAQKNMKEYYEFKSKSRKHRKGKRVCCVSFVEGWRVYVGTKKARGVEDQADFWLSQNLVVSWPCVLVCFGELWERLREGEL